MNERLVGERTTGGGVGVGEGTGDGVGLGVGVGVGSGVGEAVGVAVGTGVGVGVAVGAGVALGAGVCISAGVALGAGVGVEAEGTGVGVGVLDAPGVGVGVAGGGVRPAVGDGLGEGDGVGAPVTRYSANTYVIPPVKLVGMLGPVKVSGPFCTPIGPRNASCNPALALSGSKNAIAYCAPGVKSAAGRVIVKLGLPLSVAFAEVANDTYKSTLPAALERRMLWSAGVPDGALVEVFIPSEAPDPDDAPGIIAVALIPAAGARLTC